MVVFEVVVLAPVVVVDDDLPVRAFKPCWNSLTPFCATDSSPWAEERDSAVPVGRPAICGLMEDGKGQWTGARGR
jgi:hypothetical protein